MKSARGLSRIVALGAAVLCLGAWAGTASADHGHGKHHHRDRHREVVFVRPGCGSRVYAPAYSVYCPPPRVVVVGYPPRQRVYYDPYCRETFTGLNVYYEHLHYHPHGSVAWVVQAGVPLYGYRRAPDGWARFGFNVAVSNR